MTHDQSTPDPLSDDRLRAGDADRERVAEQLRRAHGEGRIDDDELADRLGRCYAARTFAELHRLTVDLSPPDRREPHRLARHHPGVASSLCSPACWPCRPSARSFTAIRARSHSWQCWRRHSRSRGWYARYAPEGGLLRSPRPRGRRHRCLQSRAHAATRHAAWRRAGVPSRKI
ncbi:MAG: DUF1707 SHOCT-like domain-containing protein [Solirubrobacteraceae bacterium]